MLRSTLYFKETDGFSIENEHLLTRDTWKFEYRDPLCQKQTQHLEIHVLLH